MFKLANIDYSDHVIAGAYKVVQNEVAVNWTDANHIDHHDVVRTRVEGSFDVYFKDMTEYDAFLSIYEANKVDGHVPVTVTVNNVPSDTAEKSVNAFLKFEPTRNRNDFWADFMERFTITLQEC